MLDESVQRAFLKNLIEFDVGLRLLNKIFFLILNVKSTKKQINK